MRRYPERDRIYTKQLPARVPEAVRHEIRARAMRQDTSVADVVADLLLHALSCECAEREREPAA